LNRIIKSELEKRGGRKMLEVIGRIARNGHLTIPSKIRKILNIEDGDMVRFTVEDNKIVIAPGAIVDKDQAYFFNERCQKEIRESEKEFKEGKYSSFTSIKDLKKEVDSD
jgi:AbrB family looped-hinge helix DNA binding protein